MLHKILSFTATLTLVGLLASPLAVFANGDIDTTLTRVDGGGEGPIIKAKWEMLDLLQGNPGVGEAGSDDSTAAGAQFDPTGVWGIRDPSANTDGEMKYTICAIVTDPNGVSDIDGVYTDIYYPTGIAGHLGTHGNPDDVFGGQAAGVDNPTTPDDFSVPPTDSPEYDYGNQYGCGLPVEDENQLTQLTKAQGLALFCGTSLSNGIQNVNYDLPTFFPNPALSQDPDPQYFDYDEICGPTGELEKETAYVYCADKTLEWEDPAGDYKVEILALDNGGQFSHEGSPNPNFNHYEYLPLTAFETDFSAVAYGSVKLNTHKRISGDVTWNAPNDTRPSVRNTGNTRLYMGVEQDDMGLGTTDGNWNVRYDARVGNNEADWRFFEPTHLKINSPLGDYQLLEDILDLSEIEEMDFSIEIFKFPNTSTSWTGDMFLDAEEAPFRQCTT